MTTTKTLEEQMALDPHDNPDSPLGPIAFVDTETLGLDPDRHAIWEVGLIAWTPNGRIVGLGHDEDKVLYEWVEHHWFLKLTPRQIEMADPVALDISGFHARHPQGDRFEEVNDGARALAESIPGVEVLALSGQPLIEPWEFVYRFAALTRGSHLAGAVVSFDEERLRRLSRLYGCEPAWHYHLVDVENLAVGWLAGAKSTGDLRPPWSSEEISQAVGVEPTRFQRHTALGDARWAKAIYEAVMGDG